MTNDIPVNSKDFELFHYGIKGMKWGVRRKEGPDGTVSSAVKSKSDDSSEGSSKGGSGGSEGSSSTSSSSDSRRAADLKTRDVSQLSNQELRELNDRLNLEMNYNRLTATNNASAMDRGLKHVQTGLKVMSLATQIYQLKNNPLVQLGLSAITGKQAKISKSDNKIPDLEGLFPYPRAEDREFA